MAAKGRVSGSGHPVKGRITGELEEARDLGREERRGSLRRATKAARATPAADADVGYRGYMAFRALAAMGARFIEIDSAGGEPTPMPPDHRPVRLLSSNWISDVAADRVVPEVLESYTDLPDGVYMVHGIKVVLSTPDGLDLGIRNLEAGFGFSLLGGSNFNLNQYLTTLRRSIDSELNNQPTFQPANGE